MLALFLCSEKVVIVEQTNKQLRARELYTTCFVFCFAFFLIIELFFSMMLVLENDCFSWSQDNTLYFV